MPASLQNLWRLSNRRDLAGEAGLRYAARWHNAGRRIVYLAESPAGALIEVLVHLELSPTHLPPAYTLLRVAVPLELEPVSIEPLPRADWQVDIPATRDIGDRWLAEGSSALARVPSSILPSTSNVLLNPAHADAVRITIAEAISAPFDPRLLRHLQG